jgi:hypothetical protein
MFKLEVKKIALKSIVFSGYPFVVLIFSLLTTLFSLGDVVSPGEGFFSAMISVLLYALFTTAAVVLYSLLAAFIYNTLTNFGLKGIRVSLTEVEEDSAASEEVAPAEQSEENK